MISRTTLLGLRKFGNVKAFADCRFGCTFVFVYLRSPLLFHGIWQNAMAGLALHTFSVYMYMLCTSWLALHQPMCTDTVGTTTAVMADAEI